MGEKRKMYGGLVGKPEGSRRLGRIDVDGRTILKLICKGNKYRQHKFYCINVGEVGWEGLVWTNLAQDTDK
jgi:hypothetical protein